MIFRPASAEDFEAVKKKYQDATLHLLAVCPDYQGKSLGGKILDEVVRLARKSGKRAIRLGTCRKVRPNTITEVFLCFLMFGQLRWW